MAKKLARILVDHKVGDIALKAGHLVQGAASSISGLEKGGIVDSHKDAVTYARSQPDIQIIDIGGEDKPESGPASPSPAPTPGSAPTA